MPRWSLILLAAAGCPLTTTKTTGDTGTTGTGTPTGCSTDAECGTQVCLGPELPDVGCGEGPREDCSTAEQCAKGQVCHTIVDSCAPDGFGSVCASACKTDEECGPGLSCDVGACRAVTCLDDPLICPAWEQCDPASLGATTVLGQTDGCAKIPCQDDAACDGGGFCVIGVCQSARGTCGDPLLPPP
jgi:hypothetical protein